MKRRVLKEECQHGSNYTVLVNQPLFPRHSERPQLDYVTWCAHCGALSRSWMDDGWLLPSHDTRVSPLSTPEQNALRLKRMR